RADRRSRREHGPVRRSFRPRGAPPCAALRRIARGGSGACRHDRAVSPVTPTELVHRTTANRPRLFGSLLGGVVLYALLPAALSVPVRFVLAWNSALVVFLVLTLVMFARATPQKLRYRAQREDPSQVVILMLMIAAALASFVAIGFVLHDAKEQPGLL